MLQSNVVGYYMEYAEQVDQGKPTGDQGDGYSFEDLCIPMRADLVNYARRLSGDTVTAEDVVQDALVRALKAWDRWEPVGDVRACVLAWLYKITFNIYVKHYHRSRTRQAAAREYHDEILMGTFGRFDEPDSRDDLATGIGDEVREALAALSTDHRKVVEFYYFDGMKTLEIAKALGVPKSTVCTRLDRARGLLAKRLSAYALAQYRLHGAGENVPETTQRPEPKPRSVDRVVGAVDATALDVL